MATQKKKSGAKSKDYVRKLIPRNAVIFVPGGPLPDAISKLVDEKSSEWCKEYDQQQKRRAEMQSTNQVEPPPLQVDEAVTEIFKVLNRVQKGGQLKTIAHFLSEYKSLHEKKMDMAKHARDLADEMYQGAMEMDLRLGSILRGDFTVVSITDKTKAAANGDTSARHS